MALGFLPEDVGVERDLRARGGRGRVAEKRVGFHLVELSVGETRSAVQEGKSAMAPVVNGDRDAVQDDSLPVARFGSGDNVSGHVVQAGGGSGKSVGLTIEFFGDGRDEPKINADFTEVTGHFFHTEHVRFGLDTPMDLSPEIGVGAVGRGVSVNDLLKPVDDRLVVNEDMNRPFGTGSEVDDGKGLGNLGVLSETMDSRTVVKPVGDAVIDTKASSRQERDGLVCAGSVSRRIGPGPPGE